MSPWDSGTVENSLRLVGHRDPEESRFPLGQWDSRTFTVPGILCPTTNVYIVRESPMLPATDMGPALSNGREGQVS